MLYRSYFFFAVSFLLGWAACSPLASAHGREPRPTVLNVSADGSRIVLQTGRGLMASKDGGATWQWMCYEAVGADTFGIYDPSMTIAGNGAMLAADQDNGVLTIDPTWCNSSTAQPDPTTPYYIYGLTRDPVNPDTVYALTSTGTSVDNRLYKSVNDGQSWTATSARIQTDMTTPVIFETVAVAKSNPSVIYVSGVANGVLELFKSTDGGATWGLGPIYQYTLPTDYDDGVIAGIDPTNPDHLFLTIKHNDSALTPPAELLFMSTNGGTSFNQVFSSPSIGGFAISDDGTKVWAGDDESGGFYRSTNGGANFSVIPGDDTLLVPCLAYQGGKLWVCGNDLDVTVGYGIATSTDDGDTLTPFFRYCQISSANACPLTSNVGSTCNNQPITCDALGELQLSYQVLDPTCPSDGGVMAQTCFGGADGGVGADGGGLTADGGGLTADGGTNLDAGTGSPPKHGGCDIAEPGQGGSGPGLAGLFLFGLLVTLGRRRRRG